VLRRSVVADSTSKSALVALGSKQFVKVVELGVLQRSVAAEPTPKSLVEFFTNASVDDGASDRLF
jgi:hypothetical protein